MPTQYPVTLPPVPQDPEAAWQAERVSDTVIARPDEGWPSATTTYAIDAADAAEAERRLFAWIHHSYEDDLSRSTATALDEVRPGRWHVELQVLGEF
jgi:hypothetical protein